jgi:hypothetical protein
VLTARGEKIFGPSTGESAALEEGEDGGLTVASDAVLMVLVVLETEDTD